MAANYIENSSTTSGEDVATTEEMGEEVTKAEENVDKIFYVESILNKRICNGIVQYKIRWEGYGEADDTWEYIDNCHCPDLIKQFEQENPNIVPEQFETDDMKALREGKKNKRGRRSTSRVRVMTPKLMSKRRGRQSKIANTTDEGPTNTPVAAANEEENVEFVPFVEKAHYRAQDESVVVFQIIGMRPMGTGANKKILALVEYAEDDNGDGGGHEYVPLSELRKNPSGAQLLIDFFIARMQLI